MKKILIFCLSIFVFLSIQAQVSDDFSDGDFTANPAWGGDDSIFEIDGSFQLHLLGSAITSEAHLATPSVAIDNAVWEVYVEMNFNPSGTNLGRVYLTSNQENLENSLNGYYVEIGGSPDQISLYEQSGTSKNRIIDGSSWWHSTQTSPVNVGLKITRDNAGNWELLADTLGGVTYASIGTVTDVTHTTSSYFGVYCDYTSTRSTKFWFDNISVTGTAPLDLSAPVLDSVAIVSSTELDVYFSEPLDKTIAETTSNYIFDNSIGNPLSVSVDAVDSSIVHLTNGTAFNNGTTYTISVTNIEDTTSNVMADDNTSFLYFIPVPSIAGDVIFNEIHAAPNVSTTAPNTEFLELYNTSNSIFNLKDWVLVNTTTSKTLDSTYYLHPNSYVVLCTKSDTALFSGLGDVIGISGFTALVNSGDSLTMIDNFGTVNNIVVYDDAWYNDAVKDDGGYSLELINPNAPCGGGASNWTASNDISGGTPGTQNSVYDVTPDVTAPTILALSPLSNGILEITFDEAMDSSSVVDATYTFDNGLTAQSITVTEGNSQANIQLNNLIVEGVIYNVTISNMTDCSGNTLATFSDEFFIGSEPQLGDLLITEIMADPTDTVGLPNAEYLEIHNRSSKLIDLAGCVIDGSTIPTGFIQPGEYIALTANGDTAKFSPFGNVLGVSPAPSLTNNGELLILTNASGTIIDQVEFDINWYDDDIKNDGGYSLELINPEASCSGGSTNWTASNDVKGGTPGAQNSVFDNSPDVTAPDLISIDVLSDTSIVLNFSEPMDTTSLLSGTYSISEGLSVNSIALYSSDYSSVVLYLSAQIDTSVNYIVITSNLIDCPGNPISVNNSGNFIVGYTPNVGEVIINEIFADPSPAIVFPDGEFVELYNKTDKLFDISGYNFDGATIKSGFIDPNGYVSLCHVNDTAGFGLLGKTIGLSSFPSLTNSGELITFEAPDGTTIDAVEYDISWHTSKEKQEGGYSLELINPTNPCSGANNWASSSSFDGATPGVQNSVYDISPDVTPPQFVDVRVSGSNFVVVTFDEPIDTNNLNSLTITTSPAVTTSTIGVANITGDEIYIGFTTDLDTAVAYSILLANMVDCIGNINSTGNSLNFEIGHSPSSGDLIINEIFIDPSPIVGLPEAEYIELYNRSAKKIDLSNVKINGKQIGYFLLEPNDYVILTDDGDTSLFSDYSNVVPVDSWLSLNNTSMELTLTNLNGDIIDNVYYFSSWYNNDDKDGGGWSLERKNPNTPCNFANNWGASENSTGGTPGSENSIYTIDADVTSPYISKIEVIDSITLNVIFSESMDANSILSGNYTFSGNYAVNTFNIDSTDYASVIIELDDYLIGGEPQTLTIDAVTDCPGNLITSKSISFVLPQQGEVGDLIINEVLFYPSATGEDFVEVYNNSTKYIDLGTWFLANYANDSISNIKAISTEQQIIAPAEFYAITKDTTAVKFSYPLSPNGNYIQAATLPTYSNSFGQVILLNNKKVEMDRFDYDENMHFAILNSNKGVSLERVDYNRETNDETNWRSAAQKVGYGTPGLPNSQYQPSAGGDDVLTVEPEIFSPDEDGYNDILNITYELDEPGYVGNIMIYDAKGRLVRQLMINEYLSPKGTISWDGTSDTNEKGRIGIYIIFAEFYNEAGNIITIKKSCVLGTNL